jgi:predicted transcriptional regulator
MLISNGNFLFQITMELGDLEAAVLGSVLKLNKASARQVARDLEPSRGLAYSTISTTLDRLYKKGVLGRDEEIGRGGSRYIYMIRSEEKVRGKVVKGVVDRLLTAFGPSVLSTLNEYVDDIPKEELRRLEEKIQKGSKR